MFGTYIQDAERMAANRKAEKAKQQSEIDRKKKLRELKTVGQLLDDI